MNISTTKQREMHKSPSKTDIEHDMISDLPGHIIEKILSQLSIRDAVRTSMLSSKWRYKWITLPHLIFDNQCTSISSQDQTFIRSKIINIIDHVLLLHSGSIHKFKLSHRDLQGVSDIDRWTLFLSRKSIKEFVLEIWKGQRYKIHSCIYACQNLIHLELFNCLLIPPPTFKGFGCLKSLDLQHVTIFQDDFENLISSCSLLERLTLMNFDGFAHLKICAPKLQFFDVGGVFDEVSFEKTSVLAIVSIGLYTYDEYHTYGNSCNLVKFLSNLPHIQKLEVQSYFLKYLAVGHVPRRLPTTFTALQYISIRINLNHLEECRTALCLLRSAPNLYDLEMLARPEDQDGVTTIEDLWENENRWATPFSKLRVVKIACISGSRPELDFINFLLAKSPVLETMTVKPVSVDGGWELLKELLRFRRASVRAEIIYLDP